MPLRKVALLLRIGHGLILVYFIACIGLVYNAAWHATFNAFVMLAAVSLCAEAFAVYVLNNGDCPLIHVQRKFDDEKAFFEIFFSPKLAKLAIPVFSVITIIGLLWLLIRLGYR